MLVVVIYDVVCEYVYVFGIDFMVIVEVFDVVFVVFFVELVV